MVIGAEPVVNGAKMVLATFRLSETFLGLTLVALGESLEETARMVAPARPTRAGVGECRGDDDCPPQL
ncbi:MAG TPA: sodium/calcium exchanger protein [Alphaproteobacteria bacterium]|nr:sodium/calcium exchanger protein [Alphaproteobacteria bacterium]